MSLPYENAKVGKAAIGDIEAMLRESGASGFGCWEDFTAGEVVIQFALHERRVTVKASSRGYAAMWLRKHPHTPGRGPERRVCLARSVWHRRISDVATYIPRLDVRTRNDGAFVIGETLSHVVVVASCGSDFALAQRLVDAWNAVLDGKKEAAA